MTPTTRCGATLFPNPNPVAAAQAIIAELRDHATPPPKTGPYDGGWDGKHCAFLYSAETLLNWPEPPAFAKGENK